MASLNSTPDTQFGPIYSGSERTFDFTILFEDTILTITPAAIFLLAAGVRAIWLVKSPRKVASSLSRQSKLIILSAFAMTQLTVLILRATNPDSGTQASIPAASLDFAAACVLFVLSTFEHSRSVTPSTLINLYLLVSLAFDAVRLRTYFSLHTILSKNVANLMALAFATKFGVFISEAVEKRSILLAPYKDLPPEATSGLYNRSVFWWVNPLLKIGFEKTLDTNDLYDLDPKLFSANIQARFQRQWSSVKTHGRYTLIWLTLWTLKWEFLTSAIPRVFVSAAMFAQPFLISATIDFVSNHDSQSFATGWGLVGLQALDYIALAVFNATSQHLLNRCTIQMRGGLTTLIFQKTLDLSITELDASSALTLMSTDIEKITTSFMTLHSCWAAIYEVAIAMFLLYNQLGFACIGPAIVFAFVISGTLVVTKLIAKYQDHWVAAIQLRVSFTSNVLDSMRNIKLLGLSSITQRLTQGLRRSEIEASSRMRRVLMVVITLRNIIAVAGPFATFLVFILRARSTGEPLNLTTAFSVLTILQLLDRPLSIFMYSMPELVSAAACFERIQKYLLSASRNDHRILLDTVYDAPDFWADSTRPGESIELRRLGSISQSPTDHALVLKDCSFGWKAGTTVVRNVNLDVHTGSLVMIIGPIGSGKSTLLKGILGETPSSTGFVYVRNSSVAFADQQPWVQNMTIKEAVRGAVDSSQHDEEWYQEVLTCCGLTQDLKAFPRGDATPIGSKGISLSGGQKQRLALARATYAREDVLMVDDVFSGLDNETEELIFRKLFGQNGPIRRLGTTVIMVTHAVYRLKYADHIVSLDATGRISEQGTYEALSRTDGYVHSLDVRLKEEKQAGTEDEEAVTKVVSAREPPGKLAPAAVKGTNVMASEEEILSRKVVRRNGDWQTYNHYFQACGYLSCILAVVWSFSYSISIRVPSLILKYFADVDASSPRAIVFLGVFTIDLLAVSAFMILACYQVLLVSQPRSSNGLHLNLLTTVLAAPLSFFTSTDSGTTLNRFSQDLSLVDSDLPFDFIDFLLSFSATLVATGLMVSSSGYFALTGPALAISLYFIQKYYLRTSRQMRLLGLEAKAPLFSLFAETLAGLASIRAFGWAHAFGERNLEVLDQSQRPMYLLLCIQRWLQVVLDLVVAGMVTVLMIIVVTQVDRIDPALVGVGLLAALGLNMNLTGLVRCWTELETSIGAISRLREFVSDTKNENKPLETLDPGTDWPVRGQVIFRDFAASYSEDSDLVLQKVDLKVRQGEKVGVCGRSGSGKSSLLASLFHLLEYRDGSIEVDGMDLAGMPRESLRKQINVIPQEPWWVTTESVRFNMDPWSHEQSPSEEEMRQHDARYITALSRCQIWHIIHEKGGLDATMTLDFLSHGQRQLFCLARAILRKSAVVVLDEVSSNVDIRTDQIMQQIIRDEFQDCTIIAVAHRLDTIVDFDRVVVLSQGKIVEVGPPQDLLKQRGSWFKDLYES